jgi:hypothetical protein
MYLAGQPLTETEIRAVVTARNEAVQAGLRKWCQRNAPNFADLHRLRMMSRFFSRQATIGHSRRQFEGAFAANLRLQIPDALTTENLVESIRSLAVELKRGGIEIRSMRASASGITVIGVGANGARGALVLSNGLARIRG